MQNDRYTADFNSNKHTALFKIPTDPKISQHLHTLEGQQFLVSLCKTSQKH